jgi:hypothetical protein
MKALLLLLSLSFIACRSGPVVTKDKAWLGGSFAAKTGMNQVSVKMPDGTEISQLTMDDDQVKALELYWSWLKTQAAVAAAPGIINATGGAADKIIK